MAKPGKKNGRKRGRRKFLKTMTLGAGTLALPIKSGATTSRTSEKPAERERITYPRVFEGMQRKLIGFPLGGVGAGSLNLGGRGELTEWWIFNRPDKGRSPDYAFPSIWVESGNRKPVVRVLEARIMPPYERNSSDLGSDNVPGLPRLKTCKFTGEYPLARIDFEDPELPVQVSLEAFTPFVPLEPDDSGLPLAVLRYHVTNPGAASARVSIAYSIENPIGTERNAGSETSSGQGRQNDYRKGEGV
jgi:uncharacterized protein (DUF608 family)